MLLPILTSNVVLARSPAHLPLIARLLAAQAGADRNGTPRLPPETIL